MHKSFSQNDRKESGPPPAVDYRQPVPELSSQIATLVEAICSRRLRQGPGRFPEELSSLDGGKKEMLSVGLMFFNLGREEAEKRSHRRVAGAEPTLLPWLQRMERWYSVEPENCAESAAQTIRRLYHLSKERKESPALPEQVTNLLSEHRDEKGTMTESGYDALKQRVRRARTLLRTMREWPGQGQASSDSDSLGGALDEIEERIAALDWWFELLAEPDENRHVRRREMVERLTTARRAYQRGLETASGSEGATEHPS